MLPGSMQTAPDSRRRSHMRTDVSCMPQQKHPHSPHKASLKTPQGFADSAKAARGKRHQVNQERAITHPEFGKGKQALLSRDHAMTTFP